MSMDLFGVSSLPCGGGYVYFLAHCTWGCFQTLLENWAWPPRGLPISQEHTEHVSNCAGRPVCSAPTMGPALFLQPVREGPGK